MKVVLNRIKLKVSITKCVGIDKSGQIFMIMYSSKKTQIREVWRQIRMTDELFLAGRAILLIVQMQ